MQMVVLSQSVNVLGAWE